MKKYVMKSIIKKNILILLFLLFSESSLGYYENLDIISAYYDENVISLASGRYQPISQAPAVATVITDKEIEEMGAISIDEVLESVPGIHVSISSSRFSPIISVRGIHTDNNPQILMMVNSTPITQLFFGDRGIYSSTIPITNIKQIEIVRGPGSAIYGADAFSGVINIITKNYNDIDGAEGGIRYGSFNTRDAWALYGGKIGEAEISFSANYHHTEGDESRIISSDAQSLFDSVLNTNASLAPGPLSTRIERADFQLDMKYNDWQFRAWNWRIKDGGEGAGLSQALDPTGHVDETGYLIEFIRHNISWSYDWNSKASFSFMTSDIQTRQKLFPNGSILPIGSDGNINVSNPETFTLFSDGFIGNPSGTENHFYLNFESFYLGFKNHNLRFSTGFKYSSLTPSETKNFGPGVLDGNDAPVVDDTITDVTKTPFIYTQKNIRRNYFLSIQDEWDFAKNWNFTSGIRYDYYSDFGSTINPRLALIWETTNALTTKLLYGKAFRAPSFVEQYNINNPVFLGNKDLNTEKIDTVELSFNYQPTYNLKSGINLFAYKIKDLISFTPDPGETSRTAMNIGNQNGYGLELNTEWDITSDFTLIGNYAFQNSKDVKNNANAGNSPKNQIYMLGKWKFAPNWLLSTQANWVLNRARIANDPRPDIDDYMMIDLTLRRKNIVDKLDASIYVKNLFNTNAFEPSPFDNSAPAGAFIPDDYPLSGRYIGGEIRFNF